MTLAEKLLKVMKTCAVIVTITLINDPDANTDTLAYKRKF